MTETNELENPQNQVVATVEPEALEASLDALSSAGFSREHVTVITPDDIGSIESPLTKPGVEGFVHRIFLGYGADLKNLEHLHGEVVENGRAIIMVPVDEDDVKDQVVSILKDQKVHTVEYVGNWTIEVH